MPVDETPGGVDKVVADKGITWPQLWDAKGYEGETPTRYAVEGTPLLYLVDRGGRLAGRFDSLAALEKHLPEVMAAPAALPRTARDEWQRPAAIMDLLAVGPGSVVADVGAGEGYFTRHLAHRVGAKGKVHASDLDEKALGTLRAAAQADGLAQVVTVKGAVDDPALPESALDAILVVDAYHEFTAHDAMMRRMAEALRPGGRLGIVDMTAPPGRARAAYQERHHLPPEEVVADAVRVGLRLLSFQDRFVARPGEGSQYVAVLEKPR